MHLNQHYEALIKANIKTKTPIKCNEQSFLNMIEKLKLNKDYENINFVLDEDGFYHFPNKQ